VSMGRWGEKKKRLFLGKRTLLTKSLARSPGEGAVVGPHPSKRKGKRDGRPTTKVRKRGGKDPTSKSCKKRRGEKIFHAIVNQLPQIARGTWSKGEEEGKGGDCVMQCKKVVEKRERRELLVASG